MRYFRNRKSLLMALFLCTFYTYLFGQKITGKITGALIDKLNHQPVIGGNIFIESAKIGTTSDNEGKFSIPKIEIGAYILKISCMGYKTVYLTDIVVKSGQPVQVTVLLEEEALKLGDGVLVHGSLFSTPKEIITSNYDLRYEEIRRQAGSTGDIQRMIQSMPGVIPTNDQRNDLVVRGGSPNENLTFIDNVEIPNLSHFGTQGASGGPISMLNTEFISDANFLAGGFPAQYGGKLSSVLNINLREGNRENFAISFDLSMAGAGLLAESPIGESGSLMFSARRSYLELLFGNLSMTAVPVYSNFQIKTQFILDPNNKLWFISLGGIDGIKFNYDASKTDDPETMNVESKGWRIINGINWQTVFNKNGYGILGISDALDNFDQTATNPANQNRLEFRNNSNEGETTIKYDIVYNFKDFGQLNTGISSKLLRADFDIQNPIGSKNPLDTNSENSKPQFININTRTLQGAAYAQITKTIFNNLDLSAGIHYDYFEYINKQSELAPRFSLRYHISQNLNFNLSYGVFYQLPPLVFVIPIPENRALKPMRADHYIAGFSFFPLPDLKLTIESYYKEYSDYPVSEDYPTYSLSNAGDAYSISGRIKKLLSRGEGKSRGIEIYLQKKLTDQLYGQISYSYSKTDHKALDGIFRPGSFDIPHVLSVIGGYRMNQTWEFSAKLTYTTGRPYTPLNYQASIEQNRTIFDVLNTNGERMPDYSRLDFRVDYRSNFEGWNMISYFEIQNAYNRKNSSMYIFNEKTGKPLQINQIGFFPVGGIKIEL